MFREVRETLETSEAARRFYKQVNPTDYEFLAVLGLVVWNDGKSFACTKIIKIRFAEITLKKHLVKSWVI